MGWKLNHWARLLDGDHAYVLFQNLLKNGTADNMWDLHPPFQIDGNFGGTAGVSELFLQSHNGMLHLLPALPSSWTDGKITGLRTRGNFEVDVIYAGGKLDHAVITSNAGEPCKVYYNGKEKEFSTVKGGVYVVRYNENSNALDVETTVGIEDVTIITETTVEVEQSGDRMDIVVNGPCTGYMNADLYTMSGQRVKGMGFNKSGESITVSMKNSVAPGIYLVHVTGESVNETVKVVLK